MKIRTRVRLLIPAAGDLPHQQESAVIIIQNRDRELQFNSLKWFKSCFYANAEHEIRNMQKRKNSASKSNGCFKLRGHKMNR